MTDRSDQPQIVVVYSDGLSYPDAATLQALADRGHLRGQEFEQKGGHEFGQNVGQMFRSENESAQKSAPFPHAAHAAGSCEGCRMTGQNTSSAVMQQRTEPHKSLDDFPTPPWATRALLEFLNTMGFASGGVAREPAANRGHMVKPLVEYFDRVEASDIHDYGAGYPVQDYLFGPDPENVDWTITNPPFRLAEDFIGRALRTSREGCAFILRSAFLEGVGRHDRLFADRPPAYVLQFSERVVMHKGRLSKDGSTATAYCWIIWLHERWHLSGVTELFWVPPCRARLERPKDYPVEAPVERQEGGLAL